MRRLTGTRGAARRGAGAGSERAAVHDAGVELDLAEHVGDPARTDALIVAVVLDALDRRDGRVMITRFVDKDAGTRYGNMVYVRCAPRA